MLFAKFFRTIQLFFEHVCGKSAVSQLFFFICESLFLYQPIVFLAERYARSS